MSSKRHIVVIGAGVTGLTSSIFLAEAGYEVTIIAAHVPGDESIEYTSPWAGAHWNTSATPAEPMVCDWDVQTFNYWVEMLEREEKDPKLPKSGLKMQDSYHYWDTRPKEDLWWAPYVKDFRQVSTVLDPVLSINQHAPSNAPQIQWAAFCRAPSINVPQYLSYLQEKGKALGVKVVQARLPTDAGLEKALTVAESTAKANTKGKVDCFVNATGLGARELCGDRTMYPIRGQTVLVKGEAVATRSRYGDEYTYCIPRPGAGCTILGGTKEKDNWSKVVDPDTTKKILERNSLLVPELLTGPNGGFEVISVQCGLRPGRRDGPRMEKETIAGRKIVHAFGHASGGYQNSVGSARQVVQLVTESTGGSNVFARL